MGRTVRIHIHLSIAEACGIERIKKGPRGMWPLKCRVSEFPGALGVPTVTTGLNYLVLLRGTD